MLIVPFFHFPTVCCPPALLVWSKRVCFKIWVHRKYLCFCPLCGTVCVPGVSSSSHRESQLLGPLKSQSGPRWRSNAGWQDQPIRTHARTHSHLGESVKTHLFTCYAGKSRLHALLVSLWQQVVGRHFPEKEAPNISLICSYVKVWGVNVSKGRREVEGSTSTEMLVAGTWVYWGM